METVEIVCALRDTLGSIIPWAIVAFGAAVTIIGTLEIQRNRYKGGGEK